MSTGLGREDIRALLDDLARELAARGARAELFLVGGAALAVAYDATRATRDLDAVFVPSEVVRKAAAAVAEREGLAEDWLNDEVKWFLPGPDPDAQRFYASGSLIVDVASPRYLLAMKLFAARAEIDADDIILLYRQLGITAWTRAWTWSSRPTRAARSRPRRGSSSPRSSAPCRAETRLHRPRRGNESHNSVTGFPASARILCCLSSGNWHPCQP